MTNPCEATGKVTVTPVEPCECGGEITVTIESVTYGCGCLVCQEEFIRRNPPPLLILSPDAPH